MRMCTEHSLHSSVCSSDVLTAETPGHGAEDQEPRPLWCTWSGDTVSAKPVQHTSEAQGRCEIANGHHPRKRVKEVTFK